LRYARAQNAHLRQVNSAFTNCEQRQNSSCYTNFQNEDVYYKNLKMDNKKLKDLLVRTISGAVLLLVVVGALMWSKWSAGA
jgi:hypothetical protein